MLHLNCINGHLLIECYSVIVIECQPTSSCLILCDMCLYSFLCFLCSSMFFFTCTISLTVQSRVCRDLFIHNNK